MSALMMPEPRQRYYNNDGTVAAGCYLYTYAAGTSTPKAAYQDSAGTIPHSNPIVLDAKGEAVIYWSGSYKVDLKTSGGVQITGYPVDNFISDFLTAEEVQEIVDAAVNPLVLNRNGLINGGMRVALNNPLTLTSTFTEGKVSRLFGRVTNVTAGTLTQGNDTAYASNCYANFSGVTTSAASVVEGQIRMVSGQAGEYANDACVFSCLVYQDTGASVNYTISVRTPTTTPDDFSVLTTIATSSAIAVASGANTRISFAVSDMSTCTKGIAIEISANLLSTISGRSFRIAEAQFETGTTRTNFAENIYEVEEAGVISINRSLPNGYTAITQPLGDKSTKVANTDYVDRPGSIVQAVYAENTTQSIALSTTVANPPISTDGTSIVSASITPNSASNYILCEACIKGDSSAGAAFTAMVFKSTTLLDWSVHGDATNPEKHDVVLRKQITAGGTSSITFTLRAAASSALNASANPLSGQTTSLRLTEIHA